MMGGYGSDEVLATGKSNVIGGYVHNMLNALSIVLALDGDPHRTLLFLVSIHVIYDPRVILSRPESFPVFTHLLLDPIIHR